MRALYVYTVYLPCLECHHACHCVCPFRADVVSVSVHSGPMRVCEYSRPRLTARQLCDRVGESLLRSVSSVFVVARHRPLSPPDGVSGVGPLREPSTERARVFSLSLCCATETVRWCMVTG